MDPDLVVEFVELLRRVPPLLDACVCEEIATIKTLRLVNKEASKVALLALKSYELILEGFEGYSNVSGASLLQGANLQDLSVHLHLCRSFSPTILLKAFMQEVGASLCTLTSLAVHLRDQSRSVVTAAAKLDDAILTLVSTCPALTSFTVSGRLSLNILRVLGETCPELTDLIYVAPCSTNQAYLQQLLLLQPTILPHISSLTIQYCNEEYYENLPNMTGNTSITSLHLHNFAFRTEAEWLHLPPKLQHLECFSIREGPPALMNGRNGLGSLLTLGFAEQPPNLPLDVFIRILQAAPALQGFNGTPDSDEPSCIIDLSFSPPLDAEEAAYLATLLSKFAYSFVRDAMYSLDICSDDPDESLLPSIALMPVMTGIKRLQIINPPSLELGALLCVFPYVTQIWLDYGPELTDVDFQDLAVCSNLTSLRLEYCNKVSPMGLFALCQRLPLLLDVTCKRCSLLEGDAIEGCVRLLQKHDSLARLVYKED